MDNLLSLDYLTSQLDRRQFPKNLKERMEAILNLLQQNVVDIPQLRKLCEFGIPDDIKGLRSLCWKLLLKYLPADRSKWHQTVKQYQDTYHSFCADFMKPKLSKDDLLQLDTLENDSSLSHAQSAEQQKMLITQSVKDHPLSKNKGSHWKSFFEDQILWDEVEKDTMQQLVKNFRRTRAELSFFVSPTQTQNEYPVQYRTQTIRERQHNNDIQHKHFDILTRILFVYAKLNPAIRYVQGMNEILAPFYYAFHDDFNPIFHGSAEADSFFCFTMFMADAKDSFIRSLDNCKDGIKGKMDFLNTLLKNTDEEVWRHFENLDMNPQFYSLRWIMLYLTQEFELFDVLRIWDSLLSKENKNYYLNFLCLGIIKHIRERVLSDDFAEAMEALQRLQKEDITAILNNASQLFNQYGVE